MGNDSCCNRVPILGMQFVATAFDADKPCAGDGIGKGRAMLNWKDRI